LAIEIRRHGLKGILSLAISAKIQALLRKKCREFVDARLGKKYKSPLREVIGSTVLGSADFVKEIKNRFIEGKKANRDLPALRELSSKPAIGDITKEVESVFNQQPAQVKNVSLYLCHRHIANRLKQIGRHFNIGESAVSQASRRIDMRIKQDKKLNKRIKRVESKLSLSRV